MSRFQEDNDLVEVKKIREFVEKLGFTNVSDSSSENQIYTKNGTNIVIREREK